MKPGDKSLYIWRVFFAVAGSSAPIETLSTAQVLQALIGFVRILGF